MSNATLVQGEYVVTLCWSEECHTYSWSEHHTHKMVWLPDAGITVPDFVPGAWSREYTDEKLATLAFEAAAYIDSHGWNQGSYSDARGRVCAMGALSAVTSNDYAQDALSHVAAQRVRNLGGYHIPSWNDAPDRTADEVIDMWLAVAEHFEARALVAA